MTAKSIGPVTKTHILKLKRRGGVVNVTEYADKVVIYIRFTKYGILDDEKHIIAWLAPIFEPYDNDDRPVVMENPDTGEMVEITGRAGHLNAILWVMEDKPGKPRLRSLTPTSPTIGRPEHSSTN